MLFLNSCEQDSSMAQIIQCVILEKWFLDCFLPFEKRPLFFTKNDAVWVERAIRTISELDAYENIYLTKLIYKNTLFSFGNPCQFKSFAAICVFVPSCLVYYFRNSQPYLARRDSQMHPHNPLNCQGLTESRRIFNLVTVSTRIPSSHTYAHILAQNFECSWKE